MRYLSICSGLEGATLAWHSLGWVAVGFAEIEKFPSAIISEHYGSNLPGEPLSHNAPPNFGDFTQIEPAGLGPVDILVGGTPCQAFSVAGKRLSLADARGNLSLSYVVLAHELARSNGLRNAVWENVPGVLNTPDNAFGCFLGALVGSDDALHLPRGIGGWPHAGMVAGPRARAAWRILDAQYFGLAQRRERVFVVADFGTGADPAEILFECKSVRGNPAPSREKRKDVAPTISARTQGGGGLGTDFDCDGGLVAGTLGTRSTHHPSGVYSESDFLIASHEVAQPLLAKGNSSHRADAESYVAEAFGGNNTTGPIDVATAVNAHGGPCGRMDFESEMFVVHALRADGFDASEDGTGRGTPIVPVVCPTLQAGGNCTGGVHPPGTTVDTCESLVPVAGGQLAIAFDARQSDVCIYGERTAPLDTDGFSQALAYDLRGREGGAQFEGPHETANMRAASGGSSRSYVAQQWAVRRLTPTECERLQGIPDGYTAITYRGKPAADGPRYKALGNSWAIPVIYWIGRRIARALTREEDGR